MKPSEPREESPEAEEPATPPLKKRRLRSKRESDALQDEIISVPVINVERQGPSQFLHQDTDQMFLLSQLPLIKTIKPSDKVEFQIKFMQLLQSYTS